VAGLLGVRNRRGGVYDWAGTDWARDVFGSGDPVIAEGLEHIPREPPADLRLESLVDVRHLGAVRERAGLGAVSSSGMCSRPSAMTGVPAARRTSAPSRCRPVVHAAPRLRTPNSPATAAPPAERS